MTIEELRSECQRVVDSGRFSDVRLVLNRAATGNGIRLAGRRGPIGEVLCVNHANQTMAAFDAKKVLKWLDKMGL